MFIIANDYKIKISYYVAQTKTFTVTVFSLDEEWEICDAYYYPDKLLIKDRVQFEYPDIMPSSKRNAVRRDVDLAIRSFLDRSKTTIKTPGYER